MKPEPALTDEEKNSPPETRVFAARAIRLGVAAAHDGDPTDTCPWPANGPRPQRAARHFWLKGHQAGTRTA